MPIAGALPGRGNVPTTGAPPCRGNVPVIGKLPTSARLRGGAKAVSATATSRIVCGRARGSFCRQCRIRASNASGTSGATSRSGSGASAMMLVIRPAACSPWNGRLPERSS